MKDLRIPGFLWVVGIAVAIVLIETFMPTAYQMYGEIAVVAILAVAKGFNLGTDQIDELLATLRRLQVQVPGPEAASVEPDIAKHEPSKLTTWLLG